MLKRIKEINISPKSFGLYPLVRFNFLKFPLRTFAHIKREDNYFDEEMKEVLALKNLTDLVSESSEYLKEYKRILEIVYSLTNEFELSQYQMVLEYIQFNQANVGHLLKDFETIFVSNLNQIDMKKKAESVILLSKGISSKRMKFDESVWYQIYRDFIKHMGLLSFGEFTYYIKAFDDIKKFLPSSRNSHFGHEIENFMNFHLTKFLNSENAPKITSIEDLMHLSKLVHMQHLRVSDLNEDFWRNINRIVYESKDKIDINYSLIISSLYISYYEATGGVNVFYVLESSLKELSKYLTFLLHNFDLLSYNDQVSLTQFSDTFFFFYKLFMYTPDVQGVEAPYLQNLIKIYTIRIKGQDEFKLFSELRIIHFISKKLNYKDTDFWTLIGNKTKESINAELSGLAKIFSPKLIKNSSISDADHPRLVESELSVMFHSGLIIDTFASAGYADMEFWDEMIKTIDTYSNFKLKEHSVVIQFICHSCRVLYLKDEFAKIWEKFCQNLDLTLREIVKHREVINFIVKTIKSKQTEINMEALNRCFTKLFAETGFNLTQLKMFTNFLNLIKHRLLEDDKCLRLIANVLIDIVKESKNKTDVDNLTLLQNTLNRYKVPYEKITQFMKERILSLLRTHENLEEEEIRVYFHMFRKLMAAHFTNRLDLVRMMHTLEKESALNGGKALLFERVMKI